MTYPQLPDDKPRCCWCGDDPVYVAYHDREWGEPTHDDRRLFELLILESAQAGLSWITILKRRAGYDRAYEGWDVEKIARYDATDVERLLADPGVIRNRRKVEASVNNAQRFLEVRNEWGSFDRYLWSFTDYRTLRPETPPRSVGEIPATSPESHALSRDLKRRGFRFVGPTICYAYMQACGLVDDHMAGCFKCKTPDTARDA